MKKVVIIGAEGVMASQITGVIDFFMICNQYWKLRSGGQADDLFEVVIAAETSEGLKASSHIMLPTVAVSDIETPDAVFIAGGVSYDHDTLADYYQKLSPVLPYIEQWHGQEVPICSYCSSTFVLAEMGLLDGKQATSVWWLANLFQCCYPNVELSLDQLVVRDGNVFTAGATTSYLNLCLAVTTLLFDEALSSQMAKVMLVEPNRASQLSYMTLQTFEQHNDSLVSSVQKWMTQNLSTRISLDELADKFATTKRTLNRRFKKALNDTPVNYLQKVRVEAAKRLLESSDMAIEQIVHEVGYEDTSSFRKLFMDVAELSPKAYRDKFQMGFGISVSS